MAHALTCPSCGETDEVSGELHEEDIRVTCGACRAVWMRGAPVCASCGGGDIVERPQAMTRHSRGTQLPVIGWRQIPLCRLCDSEALRNSTAGNAPVPGGYVSAALYALGTGTRTAEAPPGGAARTDPERRPPEGALAKQRPRAVEGRQPHPDTAPPPRTAPEGGGSGEAARPQRTAQRSTAAGTGRVPRPAKAGPAPGSVPTVRQAVAAFLAESSGEADSTAMLLLGTHLGSYNRLSVLDEEAAAGRLRDWFDARWQDRGSAGAHRARETLCRAADFWGARGWLTSDPMAGLR